jgi:predicted MFS family arabinose efflux permease
MILGPIIGGFVLARFGLAAVYGAGALAHLVTLVMMFRLTRQPADRHRDGRLGFSAIRHGFAYMRPRPVLKGLLWIDLIAMAFGMRRALFPILAVQQFGRGPEVVGLLMAAIPAGALAMSLTAGWLEHVHRQGLGLVVAAAVWGAAVAAFGLSGANLWLGLLLLAVAGGADVVAAILRATIIQHEVPEFVRGRVWGINFLVLNGGPRLGDMTAGMTAAVWGATFSVVAGGVAALIGAGVFAVCVPELTRYTSSQGIDPVDDGQTALRGET